MSDKMTWPMVLCLGNPREVPTVDFYTWSLQEDAELTEGMWITIRGLCEDSDFAYKWFGVNSS